MPGIKIKIVNNLYLEGKAKPDNKISTAALIKIVSMLPKKGTVTKVARKTPKILPTVDQAKTFPAVLPVVSTLLFKIRITYGELIPRIINGKAKTIKTTQKHTNANKNNEGMLSKLITTPSIGLKNNGKKDKNMPQIKIKTAK